MKNTGIIFIIAVLVSCTKKEAASVEATRSDNPHVVSLTEEQAQKVGIETGTLDERVLSGAISVTGMLDVPPQNLVNITAPFGGFLRSTSLLQGMHIAKGSIVAVIENPEYIQLQQDFLDSKSQVEFLQSEFQRQTDLAKENINSQKTLQKATADLNSMKAKNNGLRAKLKMLNIDPDKLSADVIKSTIELRSPIEGYVTQVNSSIGSFVNPTDVIFRIVDTDHLHAELIAFERELPRIKIGQKIRFVLANETEERSAKVYLIGKEISKDRTVRIHGHLDKEDRDLIPGMYLKAVIETGGKSVPSLPADAVVNFNGRDFVFVKEPGRELNFKEVEVKVGVREGNFVEIQSPVETLRNASIVTRGAYKLLSKLKNDEDGHDPGK